MTLSEVGQSRIRGYLFILGRSLRCFLPRDVVEDAIKEVESHILERLGQTPGEDNEREAVERVLGELGPPLRVAQAYSTELRIEEAVTTGGIVAVLRAALLMAGRTAGGFLAGIGLFTGYALGVGFVGIAILKPVFPNNVGVFLRDGDFNGFGAIFPAPAESIVLGGYWVIPFALTIGVAMLLLTHRVARGWLARRREQAGARFPAVAGSSEVT